MELRPHYRIDWDALNALPASQRMGALKRISEEAHRVTSAARTRIAARTYEQMNTGHGSVKAAAAELGISPERLKQLRNDNEENSTMVTINTVAPAELHRQYQGQHEPQDCYVEVDLEGRMVLATYNAEVGNARPETVLYGIERRYEIPALTSTAANELLEKIRPFAERMVSDWEKTWDGSNMVAVLGDDAEAAETEIEAMCADMWEDHEKITVWDTDGAIAGDEAETYGITADTTDERLEEIEAEILKILTEVSASDEVVLEGVTEYLESLRDDAAEDDE